MTAKEFFDLVSDMRKIQKAYFQCDNKNILEKREILKYCKPLEKKVDDEIKRVNEILIKSKQRKLDL